MKIFRMLQIAASIFIFFAIWKTCSPQRATPAPEGSSWFSSHWLFWVFWIIEAGFMTWWLFSELQLTYLKVNPFVYAGWGWVIVSLLLYVGGWYIPAIIMTGIAGIPLAIMGLFIGVVLVAQIFKGPFRWN